MISILIPVYNFDASDLFSNLSEELKFIDQTIEVIVFDDHSTLFEDKNRNTAKKLNFNYSYLPNNIGRSKIRNALAEEANFEYLLFLDGDIVPNSKRFIKNYIGHIDSYTEVIYGGRIHEIDKKHKNKLRWKYGYFREDKPVLEREERPYISISTHNLLIKKSIFQGIRFSESLKTYGHEDTLFAFELKKRKAKVQHINNPVVHKDIDDNAVFLGKTEMALKNLKTIVDAKLIPSKEIKLLRAYENLNSKKMKGVFTLFFSKFQKIIKERLISDKNNLFLFDIYKLGYFCKINRR